MFLTYLLFCTVGLPHKALSSYSCKTAQNWIHAALNWYRSWSIALDPARKFRQRVPPSLNSALFCLFNNFYSSLSSHLFSLFYFFLSLLQQSMQKKSNFRIRLYNSNNKNNNTIIRIMIINILGSIYTTNFLKRFAGISVYSIIAANQITVHFLALWLFYSSKSIE